MKRLVLAAALLALAPRADAQQQPAPSCDCAHELDWVAAHAARNYAGFSDKVTAATRPAYDALLDSLRGDARAAASVADCNQLLARWVRWFRDNHLDISRPGTVAAAPAAQGTPDEIRARFRDWQRLELGDEATVRARLDALGDARDSIEGIFESVDGRYRVAVVRDARAGAGARDFAMVILRADSVWWTPGQVKATFARDTGSAYATTFYMLDHSERRWEARAAGPLLAFSGGSPWLRRWPARDTVSVARYRATLNTRFDAREVAPGTVLVNVPTFSDPAAMDSLWARHGALIRGAERLVIDVRGNGGGSDYNFREFLPLLWTDPMRTPGNWVYATDENLAANEAMARDTAYPAAQRERIRLGNEAARRRRGRDGWWKAEGDVYRLERLPLPREVAIVQDGGCASSCEGFLMRARQSRKVTTYGSNTAGIFDYGNVRDARMPCGSLVLRHPTTKSGYLPGMAIDNVGLAPQVRIPAGESFPVEWVLRRMGVMAGR